MRFGFVNDYFDLDLRHEVNTILRAAIHLSVSLLPAEAADFGDRHARNALFDERVTQPAGAFPAGLVRPGIEPDFERKLLVDLVDHFYDNLIVPPNRGRHRNKPREHIRKPEPKRERGQRAQR